MGLSIASKCEQVILILALKFLKLSVRIGFFAATPAKATTHCREQAFNQKSRKLQSLLNGPPHIFGAGTATQVGCARGIVARGQHLFNGRQHRIVCVFVA